MKKIIILLFAFALFFSFSVEVYAEETGFDLCLKSESGFFVDDNVYVDVHVSNYAYQQKTSAIDFSIRYNSEDLQYVSYEVLDNNNLFATVTDKVYSVNENEMRLVITLLGANSSIDCDTSLLRLNFTPQRVVYNTGINIQDSIAATTEGVILNPINHSTYIRIANILDVNKDGVINISDLAIIAGCFGEDATIDRDCDVNRDGNIDTEDLQLIIDYLMN